MSNWRLLASRSIHHLLQQCLGLEFDSAHKMDRLRVIPLSWTSLPLITYSSYQTFRRCESMWACCPSYCVVSSWLYDNSLLYEIKSSQMQRLQKVQNHAANLIYMAHKHDHVTPLLKELHWLPIKQRIVFKVLTVVHKCIQNKAPVYLNSLIVPYQSARHVPSLLYWQQPATRFSNIHQSWRQCFSGMCSSTLEWASTPYSFMIFAGCLPKMSQNSPLWPWSKTFVDNFNVKGCEKQQLVCKSAI